MNLYVIKVFNRMLSNVKMSGLMCSYEKIITTKKNIDEKI